ncbi:histidine phosphatase family protein [Paenibacillus rhizovicinus]|uniref:Histidine phosphatase family protein n=1 Tax=Paenibacillus rhizovicinus TaxID=2704463 RepID=A0A6C0NZP2_9BACL|nr:histidine phosphatase family protein [Paenibacillus rhizovicinus]QHW31581.1 histidine phosphatase family protein [Paenibacillus rhizovicinus]
METKTNVLLIRHAESAVHLGADRTRGLTEQGGEDVLRLTAKLGRLPIDTVVSSPYTRAVLTVQGIADERNLPVLMMEDLRERRLHGEDVSLPKATFLEAIKQSFADPDAVLPGGESFREAQSRGVRALQDMLQRFRGQTIAVGTHGNLMTMIMQAYDARYDYAFWQRLTMPDVYRLTFDDDKFLEAGRAWS